jgi:hypothetical protein
MPDRDFLQYQKLLYREVLSTNWLLLHDFQSFHFNQQQKKFIKPLGKLFEEEV